MNYFILLTAMTLILFSMTTNAATKGPYVGLGLGVSKIHTPGRYLYSDSGEEKQSQQLSGFGSRVAGGYNLNDYFGVEAGVTRFANSSYKTVFHQKHSSLRHSMKALDLVGKAYLPVGQGFDVYALGGLAQVQSQTKFKNGVLHQTTSHTNRRARPKYGVGMSYKVNSRFTTSVEYSRVQGIGNARRSHGIPNGDAVLMNFTFNLN